MKERIKINIYIVFIAILGFLSLFDAILHVKNDQLFDILYLGVLAAIAESLMVEVNGKGISVSSALTICAMLTNGMHAAVIVSALSLVFCVMKTASGSYMHIFNIPLYKTTMNVSNYAISNALAGYSFLFLSGSHFTPSMAMDGQDFGFILKHLTSSSLLIIIFILMYIITNTLIIAMYFHINGRGLIFQEWIRDFLWSFASLIIICFIGVMISAIYTAFSWFVLLIFFSPLLLARFSFSLYSSLQSSYRDTVKALSEAIEAKDSYTRGHSQRVVEYSEMIADEIGLSLKRKETLKLAAMLHDVGKIGITESILNKPGRLDDEEYSIIKQHPELGAKIAQNVDYLSSCVDIIRYHHTFYNGSGYPREAEINNIPQEAFIIGVADAYDAMTSKRPYRAALSMEYALSEIESKIGSQFEPKAARAFITLMQRELHNTTKSAPSGLMQANDIERELA